MFSAVKGRDKSKRTLLLFSLLLRYLITLSTVEAIVSFIDLSFLNPNRIGERIIFIYEQYQLCCDNFF
jgi:hypothetical protein